MNPWTPLNWHPDLLVIVAIDLAIAIVLMSSLRLLAGLISGVSTTAELSERDNPAFGISLAASLGAIALVMTGAVAGAPGQNLISEALVVAGHGVLGIMLLSLSRFIFDRVSMPAISIQGEILRGNLAAALANAGNTLATAIIIRAVMIWAGGQTLESLLAVVLGFITSQMVLTLATLTQALLFRRRNQGASLQSALQAGHHATAMRFLGHRIGVALAVTAASGFVPFAGGTMMVQSLLWAGVALVVVLLLPLLAALAQSVILAGIRVTEEIDRQNNIGVATIEATIFMTTGLLLAVLIA